MHTLTTSDIEEFTSRQGVCERDVRKFLDSVGQAGSEEGDLLSLYYEARLYSWSISTVWAIEAGIRLAYLDSENLAGPALQPVDKSIESPLPGAHYSLWPRR